jgi:hypothetical protein
MRRRSLYQFAAALALGEGFTYAVVNRFSSTRSDFPRA